MSTETVKFDHSKVNKSHQTSPAEFCYDLEDLPLRMDELQRARLLQEMEPSLREFAVKDRSLTGQEMDGLRAAVEHARGKKDIQKFMKDHPHIMAHPLESEHRWCIPQKKLGGCPDAPDFLLGQMGTLGLEWYGIELESPHTKPFTRKDIPSAALAKALACATGWRTWLKENIDYARRPFAEGGLNLMEIGENIPYYIAIGRRKDLDEQKRERRRQFNRTMNVSICTYDWLLEVIRR